MPQSYLFKSTILKNGSQDSSVGTVTRLWGWIIQNLFAGRDKIYVYIYRVSQEECARLWKGVPYVKIY
jgi:hypothetical protein